VASAPPSSKRLSHSALYTSPCHYFFSRPAFSRDDLNAFHTTIVAAEFFGGTELFSTADVEPQVKVAMLARGRAWCGLNGLLGGIHSLKKLPKDRNLNFSL